MSFRYGKRLNAASAKLEKSSRFSRQTVPTPYDTQGRIWGDREAMPPPVAEWLHIFIQFLLCYTGTLHGNLRRVLY